MILVDSDIWCFYFDESAKEHGKVAKTLENILKKEQVLSNSVVVTEVSHFLVKNLGPRSGKAKVDVLLSFPMAIADLDFHLTRSSIDMLCDYSHTGIGGRGSTLLATLKQAKTNKILTHDAAFKKIDWVDVVDPLD